MHAFCTATCIGNRRGIILITSYLLLSILLLYSQVVAVQTFVQSRTAERLTEQLQARDLALGALAPLRENLYFFLTKTVYQQAYHGNAVAALAWLDDVGLQREVPLFDLSPKDAQRDATIETKLPIVLPTLHDPGVEYARAWIVSVAKPEDPANPGQPDPDPLAPRLVTMEAEAKVGNSTTRLQATYEISLGMSDIFRYAYFVNNYGWISHPYKNIGIYGDMRSNGNLRLAARNLTIDGDLYASENPEVDDPITGERSAGLIDDGGYNPMEHTMAEVWQLKRNWSYAWIAGQVRPTRRLVFPDQPAIACCLMLLTMGYGPVDTA